jgi:hypothetical protein
MLSKLAYIMGYQPCGFSNKQNKSEAHNELLKKFKQVEPMRDTVVREVNSMHLAFHK